jgi:hypothetical protein
MSGWLASREKQEIGMCECYQIGGRFIAEDPDCPEHGTEAQRDSTELEALRKDAERYRFLRNDFSAASLNIDGNHSWAYRRNFSLLGSTLDEAIDKAIAG